MKNALNKKDHPHQGQDPISPPKINKISPHPFPISQSASSTSMHTLAQVPMKPACGRSELASK
jgi:hypothetical protein